MLKLTFAMLGLSFTFALGACGSDDKPPVGHLRTPEPEPPKPWERRYDSPGAQKSTDAPSDFSSEIIAVGAEYLKYTRRGNRASWSPTRCWFPPVSPQLSTNRNEAAHGQKLYFLYVKDNAAYESLAKASSTQAKGQALVKESYKPVEVSGSREEGWDAQSLGRYYKLGEKAGLFVMLKLDPKTPGTDKGWVYGTLTPDAKTVTSQGRIESCMGCHEDAAHDRLFGPAKAAPERD